MTESTVSTPLTPDEGHEDVRMGGEGFGNVVMLAAIIGGLVVLGMLVFAILALTGQFQNEFLNPPV